MNPRLARYSGWAAYYIYGFRGLGDMVGGASDLQNGETDLMHSNTGRSWNKLQVADPRVANLIDVKFRTNGAALGTIALMSMAV